MKEKNRLHMISKLSFIKDDQLSLFKSYIPNHYNEIYTLYTIFDKAFIDYNDIDFYEPIEEDNYFIFLCSCDKDIIKKLKLFIKSHGENFNFFRKQPSYNISLDQDNDKTKIIFSKAE